MTLWNEWTQTFLLILGGGSAIIISVINVWDNKKKEEKLDAQNLELRSIQAQLAATQDTLIRNTKENFDYITGGNSIPNVNIIVEENQAIVIVHNEGEFPLYDVNVDVLNEVDVSSGIKSISYKWIKEKQKSFKIDFIAPKTGMLAGAFSFRWTGNDTFRSSIFARNGQFTQRLGVRHNGTEPIYAVVIRKHDKEVYRFIHPEFLKKNETFEFAVPGTK